MLLNLKGETNVTNRIQRKQSIKTTEGTIKTSTDGKDIFN